MTTGTVAQTMVQARKRLLAKAKTTRCGQGGCDLTRWLSTSMRLSANCSVCHRIYATDLDYTGTRYETIE